MYSHLVDTTTILENWDKSKTPHTVIKPWATKDHCRLDIYCDLYLWLARYCICRYYKIYIVLGITSFNIRVRLFLFFFCFKVIIKRQWFKSDLSIIIYNGKTFYIFIPNKDTYSFFYLKYPSVVSFFLLLKKQNLISTNHRHIPNRRSCCNYYWNVKTSLVLQRKYYISIFALN